MLNRDAAAKARDQLKTAAENYNQKQRELQARATALYDVRRESSELLIGDVEALVNGLVNVPKEFNLAFAEYQFEYRTFPSVRSCCKRSRTALANAVLS